MKNTHIENNRITVLQKFHVEVFNLTFNIKITLNSNNNTFIRLVLNWIP